MCVSEDFGLSCDSQPSRFKDVASAALCYHSTINLSIQKTELFKNQSVRLSGQPGRHKSDNHSCPDIERYCRDRKQRGGDEIEGFDSLEVTRNRPVSSGSKAYLT